MESEIQSPHGNPASPSPHRSAALGLTLFIVGGLALGIAAGNVWNREAGWMVFGISVVVGLLWSVQLMGSTINHRAYMERRVIDARAVQIENESRANLVHAKIEHAKQIAEIQSPKPQPMLAAPQQGQPAQQQPALIRVLVMPRKGQAVFVECSTRLVQWAISDCWPLAAREYVTTDGQKVRVWKHRDADFTEVAQFMVKIGAWIENGASFNWREGITQQAMIEWYRGAMRNGGEASLPEALSPVAMVDVFSQPA